MKDMKMKTKTILGFAVPIALTIFNVVLGNMSLKRMMKADDSERYFRNASIFTIVVAAVSILITVLLARAIINAIEKNVKQFYEAAKVIALGRVDVNVVKYHDDEFGALSKM